MLVIEFNFYKMGTIEMSIRCPSFSKVAENRRNVNS